MRWRRTRRLCCELPRAPAWPAAPFGPRLPERARSVAGRDELDDAVLLAGAAYVAVQHKRFEALFACVAVAVASVVINSIWPYVTSRWRDVRMRRILATGAVVAFAMLASVRAFDLVTNRHYLGSSELATFGTGLAWWCPERAAAFPTVRADGIAARVYFHPRSIKRRVKSRYRAPRLV